MRPCQAERGGILGWLTAGLLVVAASGVLAWMLLLPAVMQSRFTAATGAELSLRGLMGDPFAGRATVTGWTLHAGPDSAASVLAHGGRSTLVATDWRAALDASSGEPAVIDSLDLAITEAVLAPDTRGAWPLLALAAASGLPYEKNGPTGVGPRVTIKRLRLAVGSVIIRDAHTGREKTVPIAWRGEFRDLDHSRPLVAALLEAARTAVPAP
jgi:hypothetical protein